MMENSQRKSMQNTACSKGKKGISFLLLLAAAVFLVSALLSGAAGAEKVIAVDTTSVVGLTGDTALVPVTVSNAEGIHAYQLNVETRDDDVVKIVPNSASVRKAKATSTGKTVYWYTTSTNPANFIKGDQTLFYIAVTPKVKGEIPVNISGVRVYENNENKQSTYKVVNGVLSVNGEGSGLTYGDSDSGATVRVGETDTSGNYVTGDETGIREIQLDNKSVETVIDHTDSTGPYDLPEGVEFAVANEAYLFGTWKTGDKYSVKMGVKESALSDAGITSENLFILHPIEKYDKNNELIGVGWYKPPITSIATIDNGIVEYTFDTWSGGPFILVTNDGGNKFETETAKTAIGGSDFTLDPVMLAIIGGIAAVIIIVIVVIVVVKRRRT